MNNRQPTRRKRHSAAGSDSSQRSWHGRLVVGIGLIATLAVSGCRQFFWPSTTISAEHRAYYHRKVAEVDAEASLAAFVPNVDSAGMAPDLRTKLPEDRLGDELWPMTLFSAVRIALQNNPVIRQDSQFLSTSNPLFNSIDANASVFDPYIQDTNITFGNRGVAGSMSDFATQLSTSMTWSHNDSVNNFGVVTDITDSTRNFDFRLEKELAFGGTLGLSHSIDFTGTSNPNVTLPSTYTGPLSVDFRLPLWAGAGTEFTQIAGPLSFIATRITSVNQGVLISQINSEVARLDLEENIRGLVRDVVDLYWDLNLAYVSIETEQQATEEAREVFDRATAEFDAGRTRAAEEAQAAETYYAAVARLEEALRIYDESERRLRRLLGLPVADGRMIQPIDEPELEALPELWDLMLGDALQRRPQIRRQKHALRSTQLQLKAARSLNRPRFDFVSQYAVNGFGDRLTSDSGSTRNYFERLGDSTLTGWTTGVQLSMPLGFPQQRAQVRNLEFRVAKGLTQLALTEAEIAHELASRLLSAQRWQRIARANRERMNAAQRLVDSLEADYAFQRGDIDQLVRAQATLAAARVEYYRSRVEFRKARAGLLFAQSGLLESNAVTLAFPQLPVAGWRHEPVKPAWVDMLPGGHLAKRLPSSPVSTDPNVIPAGGLSPLARDTPTRATPTPAATSPSSLQHDESDDLAPITVPVAGDHAVDSATQSDSNEFTAARDDSTNADDAMTGWSASQHAADDAHNTAGWIPSPESDDATQPSIHPASLDSLPAPALAAPPLPLSNLPTSAEASWSESSADSAAAEDGFIPVPASTLETAP